MEYINNFGLLRQLVFLGASFANSVLVWTHQRFSDAFENSSRKNLANLFNQAAILMTIIQRSISLKKKATSYIYI